MTYNMIGDIAKMYPNSLDRSLSLEGAAAEAQATGEAIANAKKESQQHTDNHASDAENPHKVTKQQIGLDKVDNTSDMDKPVSIAQAAAIKAVADDFAQIASGKAVTKPFTGILLAGDWTDEAPFTQVIVVDGILAKDEPFVDVDLSVSENVLDIIEAWGMVGRCAVHEDGKVTAYCYQERPSTDIPLKFKVVR